MRLDVVELQRRVASAVPKACGAHVLSQEVLFLRQRTRLQLQFVGGAVLIFTVFGGAVARAAECSSRVIVIAAAKPYATKCAVFRQLSNTDVDIGALSHLLCACRRQPYAVAEQHAEQRPGTTSRHACGRRAASRSPSRERPPAALFFRATWARFGSISCFLRVRRWDYGLIATGWRCARSWRTRPRTGRSHLRERVFHRRSRRAPTTRARLRRAPERRSTKSSVTVAMVRAPKGRKRRGRKTLLGTSQGGLLGRRLCI